MRGWRLGDQSNLTRAEPPEVFRATSAILPILPGNIASARPPDPGPSRRCVLLLRPIAQVLAESAVHRRFALEGPGEVRIEQH
jgi:hypothetical protein